jgi:hypothetical protein
LNTIDWGGFVTGITVGGCDIIISGDDVILKILVWHYFYFSYSKLG